MSSGSSLKPIDQGSDRTPLHSILAELSVYDEIPLTLMTELADLNTWPNDVFGPVLICVHR